MRSRTKESSGAGHSLTRRGFLRSSAAGVGALFGNLVGAPQAAASMGAAGFGPLLAPDANGLKLPAGFSSRVVANTGVIVPGSSYTWHGKPDGGATFATGDGGWIYVSNSEVGGTSGGVGALRFDADANLTDAYSILTGTENNCSGGPTPWNTWLSCEESGRGEVYECDPYTAGSQGQAIPAMGAFRHEAAAIDPVRELLYLTEDQAAGLFYRYVPSLYPDLSNGLLEAMEVLDPGGDGPIAVGDVRPVAWHTIPDPSASPTSTRFQVPAATSFNGGEGCWYQNGIVYFATKNDHRVWMLDTYADTLEILYDQAMSGMPILSEPDNITASAVGDVYVAEDNMAPMLIAFTPSGAVVPVVELTGSSNSEITGPALTPDGSRLYFSEQDQPGTTYEVTGPFAPIPTAPSLGSAGGALLGAAIAAAGILRLR